MPVPLPNSILLKPLEHILDTNEGFIGPNVWDQLSAAFDELDTKLSALEEENISVQEQLQEVQEKLSQLEAAN